jgi:hypothetical protein
MRLRMIWGQFPQGIIASSSTDTTPHALELRAIQDGDNAEPKKVSGFKLDMTNVVAAQINSQVLVFVTDSSVRVVEVSDQLIDLVPSSQANAFSLANLPVGVYTLDVMTQKGNAKAAYEGVLVIGQQPTTVISETTRNVINQEISQNTRVDVDTRVIFVDEEDDDRDGIIAGIMMAYQAVTVQCYFITKNIFCQCCGMQLRGSPAEREFKEKMRANSRKKPITVL